MQIIIEPYKNNIDRVMELQDFILKFKREFSEVSATNINLSKLNTEISLTMEDYCNYQCKRITQFKSLINKYWKLQYKEDIIPDMYIFPYKLNLQNNYLFALVSPINDYLFNKNGLFEDSFDIFYTFGERTLIFTECTKEEMLDNAKKMCNKALEYRLNKL